MFWKIVCALVICQAFPVAMTAAGLCITDTLANYIALGSGGCKVGSLTFMDFAFSTITSSGGPVAVTAANVTVSPVINGLGTGLNYASSGFHVTAGQAIQYLLTYTIDDPPIIHGFDLEMFTNSPVFPGSAQINSLECVGAAFAGPSCSGTTTLNTVFDNGVIVSHQDVEFFAPSITVGDRSTITLNATSGGFANFASFNELVIVPEPSSVCLIASGLFLLLRRRALR